MTPVLEPAVVAAIDDLELVARLVVDGFRAGQHRSPFHGYSAEFRQHRPYRAGDDFRHLDWKLLARTDRLYTRQFRETTNMSVMLVIDASASMGFPDGPAGEAVSKLRYATILAAALAYLIVTDGDRVGLMSAAGDVLSYLPPKGGRSHLRTLLARLERLHAGGTWAPARVVARSAELLKRRGLLFVFSDFYDAEAETLRELKRAARRGHEVTMLQLVSRPEVAFGYRGDVEFEDLESGTRQLVSAAAVAASYRAAMAAFLARWKTQAQQGGLDYALLATDAAPATALRTLLLRRGSPTHAGGPASREVR